MQYFTLSELCQTSTGIYNVPTIEVAERLEYLVDEVLDPAREYIGCPITVNSGYRSQAVNARVGGSSTSQHVKGEAADVSCAYNGKLFEYILNNHTFDQLIWERGTRDNPQWVHVSLTRGNNRQQVLYTPDGRSYTTPAWLTAKIQQSKRPSKKKLPF